MPVKIRDAVIKDLYKSFVQPHIALSADPKSQEERVKLLARVQKAYWFYIDHLQASDAANRNVKVAFTFFVHQFVRLLNWQHKDVRPDVKAYWKYNTTLPRAGGILLNADQTKILLVRGYGGKRWGFPVGKVREDEVVDISVCAVREVFEETGFQGVIQDTSRVFTYQKKKAPYTLFVFENVPEDYAFAPVTCKEIDEVRWFSFKDLPSVLSRRFCINLANFLDVYVYPATQTPVLSLSSSSSASSSSAELSPLVSPLVSPVSPMVSPVVVVSTASSLGAQQHATLDLLSLEPFVPLPPIESVDRLATHVTAI